ncbi:cytochrome P450 4C1-like [Zerene cesonia]|uniref:cytochrome P450 4C1-like n=1 Tax=Zerene cesonia TaxID=33412 RepID=UPI0018E4FBFE|nr:cytochrome P450 4C1-like [Zerene cesonia]XP_038217440.1 cytochrome P450 4C1-like [Zerene cesonia]
MYTLLSAVVSAGLIVLSLWLRWRYKNSRLLEIAAKIPGPPVVPLFGNSLMFMCRSEDILSVMKQIITDHGEIIRIWLGPDLNIVVTNPDDIKTLLTSPKTSVKGPQYKYMADVLGGGILSGSGVTWRRHRKIASPNYGKKAVEGYTKIITQEVDILLLNLNSIPKGKQINIYKEIVKCTTYTVCQTLLGFNREETSKISHLQEIIDLSPRIYDITFKRMTKWYLQIDPVFWLTDLHRFQKNFIKLMFDFGNDIINWRNMKLMAFKNNNIERPYSEDDNVNNDELSIVDRLILSNELNNEELVHEIFTVFTSSQEASAKICSYLLLMMAFHPESQETLYKEIHEVIGDKDKEITEEDFKKMPYLDMVYKEVLRLFPIGAIIQRTIQEDITISSCTIPEGASLVIPIYHIQRHERFWKNPEAFDPDRFNPENSKFRHPYCYIPFSLGPMDCIGRYFGTKLIKTIAIRVLQKYALSSQSSYNNLRLTISVSVFSLDGYPVILTPRSK